MALATPLILIGATGQMMVMLARHVELSMGSILALSSIVAGMMFRGLPELPVMVGFAAAIASGAALGLVNGALVVLFRLPAIIVTPGTLSLHRGLVFWVSDARRVDPQFEPQTSTTEAEALLQTHSDLRGIISPTTVGVAAAAQMIQSAGVADEVALTGLGTPNQMRPFVEDGTVEAFQLWSPYNEGWLAAHFATRVVRGEIESEVGGTFEVPDLGTITIQEDNVLNTQAELTTIDAENIDEYDF